MSRRVPTFAVKVISDTRAYPRYWSETGEYLNRDTGDSTKTVHIEARTHNIAFERAKKYGTPISVRRIHTDDERVRIEHLKLDEFQPDRNKPITLDEMIWLKRNQRRKNMLKDKLLS